jgi:hypothetical protein
MIFTLNNERDGGEINGRCQKPVQSMHILRGRYRLHENES